MIPIGRTLGIDYGEKRVGLALSDPTNVIATPFEVIPNSPRLAERLAELISQHDVRRVVVGLPLTLKGEVGRKGLEIRAFISRLKETIAVEIIEWDERFSSRTAQSTMREMGVKRSRRQAKTDVDAMAAAIILQGYLDRRQNVQHSHHQQQ